MEARRLMQEDTPTDEVLNDDAILWMLKDIGVDPGRAAANIHNFADKVAWIESSGDTQAENETSSAKGAYQWLTAGDENAFQDDLKGAKLYYKKAGTEAPEWIDKAIASNDPTSLTPNESKKLFLWRMYRTAPNADLKKAYSGDQETQKDLYYNKHHTDPDEATIQRVEKAYAPQVTSTEVTSEEAA